jgi:hypothetical protein
MTVHTSPRTHRHYGRTGSQDCHRTDTCRYMPAGGSCPRKTGLVAGFESHMTRARTHDGLALARARRQVQAQTHTNQRWRCSSTCTDRPEQPARPRELFGVGPPRPTERPSAPPQTLLLPAPERFPLSRVALSEPPDTAEDHSATTHRRRFVDDRPRDTPRRPPSPAGARVTRLLSTSCVTRGTYATRRGCAGSAASRTTSGTAGTSRAPPEPLTI